jgi:hypothetical protein
LPKKVIDFTGVEDRAYATRRIPAATYRAKAVKVRESESEAGNEMWTFTLEISNGKQRGIKLPFRTVLTEASLWKLRNFMTALGVKVPSKRVAVDPEKLIGRECGIVVEDDEYENRIRSIVFDTIPLSEMPEEEVEEEELDGGEEPEEEEEEEPRKTKAKTKTKAKNRRRDEEEEEEEVADEELEELDVDEL